MCSKLQDQNKDNTLFKISRFQVLCLIENQCFLFPWLFKKNHVFRPMPNIRKTFAIWHFWKTQCIRAQPIDIQEQFTKPRVSFLKWRQLVEFEAARKSVKWTSLKMYDLCPKSMCGSCLCFCSNFVWCSFQLSLLPSSWARNLFTFLWKQ